MVLSPAFTFSFLPSKTLSTCHPHPLQPQRQQRRQPNSPESPTSSSFVSSPHSSSNSIISWCNEYAGNDSNPSTSIYPRRRSIDFLLKRSNGELSAERRRFNRISLIESANGSKPLYQRKISTNVCETLDSENRLYSSTISLDTNSGGNNGATRNRVILERQSTTDSRRSLNVCFNNAENINANSTSSSMMTTTHGGFLFRIGGRSPFADLSTNISNIYVQNTQNSTSTLSLSSAISPPPQPTVITNTSLQSSGLHTSATILAARKRRASAYERLNGPRQRIWVSADVDKTVHLDERTLRALSKSERTAQPSFEQFKTIQTEITEAMRRTVVTRMNEICLRENCDLVVFPLAVSFMDRLLSVQFVPQHNLQALADAALLLAMKMKAPQPPKALNIVDGRQDRLDELFDWELFIVNKLGWALSTATPFEFFDQLIVRAPILEHLRGAFTKTLSAMLKGFFIL